MNCHRLYEVSYLGTTEQLELMEIHEQRHYAGCREPCLVTGSLKCGLRS